MKLGLFDPPTRSIARKVPVSAQPLLAGVQPFAEMRVPDHFNPTQRASAIAIVMGSWVNVHAQIGTFDMRPNDFEYVRNMPMNCFRFAGPAAEHVEGILRELIAAEMMPDIFADSADHQNY